MLYTNGGVLLETPGGLLADDENCCCGEAPYVDPCDGCCWTAGTAPASIWGKIVAVSAIGTGTCDCLLDYEFEMINGDPTPLDPDDCSHSFQHVTPDSGGPDCIPPSEVFEIACVDGQWSFRTLICNGGPPPTSWTNFTPSQCSPFIGTVTGVSMGSCCSGTLTIAFAENYADLP